MSDTIDRQAAIDYFVTNVGFHDEDGYPIEDECELREIWTEYFDGIPSAEPKIVRCKDCKWFNCIGCAIEIVDDSDKPTENDFCSFAERRTE